MQNEKSVNRSGQVRRNPSRDNKNINQGQNYEKERVDNKSIKNGDAETNQTQFSGNESPLDGSGVSNSTGNNNSDKRSGKTQQNAAGKDAGNQQIGSAQSSRAQDSNSQGESEQQQSKNKSGEPSVGLKYDANEQFDYDEDFGSHNDKENSTRQ